MVDSDGARLLTNGSCPPRGRRTRPSTRRRGPRTASHFDDAEALGLALVKTSFEALHESIRLARADTAKGLSAAGSAAIVLRFAAEHRERFRFLNRERRGGAPPLRRAIGAQLQLFEHDLAVDLMRDPHIRSWPSADVHLLAGMLVGLMAEAIDELLGAETPEEEAAVADRARRRLRMLGLGVSGWGARMQED